jgi:hypothetical protein
MPKQQVSKILEEYVLWADDVEHSIKGRVVEHIDEKNANQRYGWEISHHYRPSQAAATVYYPSRVTGASIDEVRALMLTYLRGFQNIDVTPNPHY